MVLWGGAGETRGWWQGSMLIVRTRGKKYYIIICMRRPTHEDVQYVDRRRIIGMNLDIISLYQGSETSGRNRFLPGRMEETGKKVLLPVSSGRKWKKLEEIHEAK